MPADNLRADPKQIGFAKVQRINNRKVEQNVIKDVKMSPPDKCDQTRLTDVNIYRNSNQSKPIYEHLMF